LGGVIGRQFKRRHEAAFSGFMRHEGRLNVASKRQAAFVRAAVITIYMPVRAHS
jgi:hypothetical protein